MFQVIHPPYKKVTLACIACLCFEIGVCPWPDLSALFQYASPTPVVSLHLIPRIQYHSGIPVAVLTGSSWFYFIEIGKKIYACGHDFEEVMHAYDNWKNPMTGDTHWTKKKPIEKQRRIEYKSDNIVVRHSFFENKMCDVRDNPRWALSHVDDMLDILENHADECAKDNLTSS